MLNRGRYSSRDEFNGADMYGKGRFPPLSRCRISLLVTVATARARMWSAMCVRLIQTPNSDASDSKCKRAPGKPLPKTIQEPPLPRRVIRVLRRVSRISARTARTARFTRSTPRRRLYCQWYTDVPYASDSTATSASPILIAYIHVRLVHEYRYGLYIRLHTGSTATSASPMILLRTAS